MKVAHPKFIRSVRKDMKDPKECINCGKCITTDKQVALKYGIHSKKELKNNWDVGFYCTAKNIPIYANMAMECEGFAKKKETSVRAYKYDETGRLVPA